MKPFARLPLWPSRLVTTTFTAPGACAAVTAVIEVALTTFTLVAATPPIVTVAPVVKSLPVRVTAVPPLAGPNEGLIVATVGNDRTVIATVALAGYADHGKCVRRDR